MQVETGAQFDDGSLTIQNGIMCEVGWGVKDITASTELEVSNGEHVDLLLLHVSSTGLFLFLNSATRKKKV